MNWEPARADHSIVRASAFFAFEKALDANSFDELVVAARRAGDENNLKERVESIEPVELPQVPEGQSIKLELSLTPRRVAFRRMESERVVVSELAVTQSRIIFTNQQYHRWADFAALIGNAFGKISTECRSAGTIKTVRLEYQDRFKATTPDADHFEVLEKSSIYLSDAVRDKTSAIHVYSGWFDFEEPDIRQLTNVNIGVGESSAGGARTINLFTMGQFERLSGGPLNDPLERLNRLHDHLKTVFGGVITPVAANRVALKS